MPSHLTLTGKHILVVDDEIDILETIEDILDMAIIDTAIDFEAAADKIDSNRYDLAILDIMGVNGLELLEKTVAKQIPTVMLTAHAINQETLMASIRQGALAYLPKETLVELDDLLEQLLTARAEGEPAWKLVFEKLGDYFDERFGAGWKEKNEGFWQDFDRTYTVSKGIQERLKQDRDLASKGI